ncbi:ATP-binding protein involved in chromosome partitioning [Actinokineospora alba]|uniref:ATP-binding protein involved in chromosome partitioning n=1 Tax=Actinokineospora alba TaxID=504798 RepID=A0A1H0HGA9_9PSEU|nr:P-loop NTPase [Actinokineospora alba]SDH49070.1 ATP-binding protein involved in chromosome partitioning [Actinokineospora alba]SDO17871.1 ATP-binding protein involved in chromosome partitioning [Actinokineospora alba]
MPDETKVIAVIGGKGGVGKTTVAAGLALALSERFRVGLLDCDLSGPSVPTLLGVQGPPEVRDGRMVPPVAEVDDRRVAVMSTGLFGDAETTFGWHGPVLRGVLRQFARDVLWESLDYLVLDTPPGSGELHAAVLAAFEPRAAVAVTTADPLAVADTRRSLRWFRDLLPVVAVVHNRAGAVCGSCGAADAVDETALADLAPGVPRFGVPAVVGGQQPWTSPLAAARLADLARHVARPTTSVSRSQAAS